MPNRKIATILDLAFKLRRLCDLTDLPSDFMLNCDSRYSRAHVELSHNNRQITYSMQAIRVFEAAARLGSFKQAAVELNLTPTAVSHQIRNLESQLKLTLFVRKTRAVTLTEEGHHLSLATSQGLRVIEDAIQTLSQNNHAIRVSTTSSFAALVLIPKLVNLQQHYPELDVAVTTGEDHDQQRETLPVRYGDLSQVAKEQQLGRDSFNLYCSPRLVCEAKQTNPCLCTAPNGKIHTYPLCH